ncbi:MAG: hypothetical protein KC420_17040, partial [Myxococcales bacterium]|nr:hypothetical protein [Myxococcales bacterium]
MKVDESAQGTALDHPSAGDVADANAPEGAGAPAETAGEPPAEGAGEPGENASGESDSDTEAATSGGESDTDS